MGEQGLGLLKLSAFYYRNHRLGDHQVSITKSNKSLLVASGNIPREWKKTKVLQCKQEEFLELAPKAVFFPNPSSSHLNRDEEEDRQGIPIFMGILVNFFSQLIWGFKRALLFKMTKELYVLRDSQSSEKPVWRRRWNGELKFICLIPYTNRCQPASGLIVKQDCDSPLLMMASANSTRVFHSSHLSAPQRLIFGF